MCREIPVTSPNTSVTQQAYAFSKRRVPAGSKHGRQMSATIPTWELEPSYTLFEEGRWKTLYSTQIHVSSGPMLTHAIPTTSPSPYH